MKHKYVFFNDLIHLYIVCTGLYICIFMYICIKSQRWQQNISKSLVDKLQSWCHHLETPVWRNLPVLPGMSKVAQRNQLTWLMYQPTKWGASFPSQCRWLWTKDQHLGLALSDEVLGCQSSALFPDHHWQLVMSQQHHIGCSHRQVHTMMKPWTENMQKLFAGTATDPFLKGNRQWQVTRPRHFLIQNIDNWCLHNDTKHIISYIYISSSCMWCNHCISLHCTAHRISTNKLHRKKTKTICWINDHWFW